MQEQLDSGLNGQQETLPGLSPVVGSILDGTVIPSVPETRVDKNILEKLRERDKPLLGSGEPAHGPG